MPEFFIHQSPPNSFLQLSQQRSQPVVYFLKFPYHQAIINNQIPLSIGGGIGQSRVYQYLLRKAALGECSVTVWPKVLRDMCAEKQIHLLQ